jgi:hypothetical protein
MLTFSFSSCSEMLSAGLALIPCLDGFIFDCACSKDDIRPPEMEVPGRVVADFVMGNLEYEEALPVGVGVPADARGLTGGGPIEPSIPRAGFDIAEEADAVPAAALFTRVLFPRADILADVESDSVDGFRSLVVVLELDMAEGGREEDGREEDRGTLGVANALDSRW